MIGVVANEDQLEVAKEFFELFKTPWVPAVPGRRYRVVLTTNNEVEHVDADVLIVYGSGECAFDCTAGHKTTQLSGPVSIEWQREEFPVYGKVRIFLPAGEEGVLKVQGQPVAYRVSMEGRDVWRIGYDLFDEIRYLLTNGQPATHALTPTLELHIDLLRHLLIDSKVPFVEVPPRPAGYDFICCLTHDVDFFGIRRHKFDRTMAGFLYRSSIGSLVDLVRGRRSLAEASRNWLAFCSLPLVLVGLLPDFWRPFEDYAKVEDRRKSTFFLVPFNGKAGVSPDGTVNTWRATPYGIGDVCDEVVTAAAGGIELGVHGIDSWHDAVAGREEMSQLSSLTGQKTTGIRMHWLYFNDGSPMQLEKAGFDYDSTCGYNEAVGYRAGTSQAFRPLGCSTLMELPMCIMDSALFSWGRMSLGWEQAAELCRRIVSHARRFGGTLVINWHERSLAPERLWGRFYDQLLEEVESGGRAWFATAGEASEWFRWRRAIRFIMKDHATLSHVEVTAPGSMNQGVVVRSCRTGLVQAEVENVVFDGTSPVEIEV